jgi:hypothetical protein
METISRLRGLGGAFEKLNGMWRAPECWPAFLLLVYLGSLITVMQAIT